MATYSTIVTLDGSGDGTATFDNLHGALAAIRIDKGTANPTVTIAENNAMQQTILNGVTVTTDTNYYPRIATQDNAGTALVYAAAGEPVPDRYQIDGSLTVTVTGGDASGAVTAYIQLYR